MEWLYFVLGLIAWQIIKMFVLVINRAIIEHRQKRFLKFVNVEFKDRSKVTFISLDASDKRAMAKLERQIREQYGAPENSGNEDRSRDRRLFGSGSREASRHRQDPPR
jgi:hypothetical protein